MGWRTALVVAGLLSVGCAHGSTEGPSAVREPTPAPIPDGLARSSLPEGAVVRIEGQRYIDPSIGFEISRPAGDWFFAPGQPVAQGIDVPVIVAHPSSGAQVVVQVAPAVATPTQFAERLTVGLSTKPGFSTGAPSPLEGTDDGVGFLFSMGDVVRGRVAIVPGSGHVFVLLATWPTQAAPGVISGVDRIVRSLKVTPVPD
ncbi:MAG: hypothetical protein ACYCWW_08365 [Deltaproteobacteria bacterium]